MNPNPPVVRFAIAIRQRPLVLGGSLVAALLVTGILAFLDMLDQNAWRNYFELAGMFMTSWALFLAIVIYIVSTMDIKGVMDESEKVKDALAEAYGDVDEPEMDAAVLRQNLVTFGEHIRQLQEKYKVPSEDITYLDRAPQQNRERNRPVLIHTRHGKRYSVFHGGAGGGWHVTKY